MEASYDRRAAKLETDEVEYANGPLRHQIQQNDQERAENGIGRRLRYLVSKNWA